MGDILLTLFWFPFSIFILFTGDLVLFVLSFGKYKPIWSRLKEKRSIGKDIFTEITFWLGGLTWIGILILLGNLNW